MSQNMSINDYIGEIVVAGSGLATTLLAWKQGQKTVKTSHLDNVDKAIKIWEDTSTKLKSSLDHLEVEMQELRKNHEECEATKRDLCEKVMVLEQTMHNLIETPLDKRKFSVKSNGAKRDQ